MNLRLIIISAIILFAGCNRGATNQETIGTLDRAQCESAGLGYAEGNPHLGTQNRCVAKGSEQENCNAQNQLFSDELQQCIDPKEDEYPQILRGTGLSVVDQLNVDEVTICIGGSAYSSLTDEQKVSTRDQVIKAMNLWIEPLTAFAQGILPEKITIVEGPGNCPKKRLIDIEITDDIVKACLLNRPACAYQSDSRIFLAAENGINFVTILHEIGHIIGMDDYYYDRENMPMPEQKENVVTGCKNGFFASVMCRPGEILGPADRVAVKRLYCGLTNDLGCPVPISFRTDFFDEIMLKCARELVVGDKILWIEIQVDYEDGLAQLALYPYKAKINIKEVDSLYNVISTIEKTSSISLLDFTSSIAARIDFQNGENDVFLSWIFSSDTLEGKIESDDKLISHAVFVEKFSTDGNQYYCSQSSPNLWRIIAAAQQIPSSEW